MNKIKYLDGIRGLSALIVFVHHFTLAFMPMLFFGDPHGFAGEPIKKIIHSTPVGIVINGNFAVCMFFVLSGYVLSHKFFITGDSGFITNSAYRRYFRLGIPVFASVMISYMLLKTGCFFNKEVGSLTGSQWLMEYWNFAPNKWDALKNGLYGALVRGDANYNPVLWTIKWELFGSFLVYSFLAIVGKSRKRYLIYIAVIALLWNTYYLAFILGMLICDVNVNRHCSAFNNKFMTIFFLIVGLYCGSFPLDFAQNNLYKYIYPSVIQDQIFMLSHIIGAWFLLIVALNSKIIQKCLSIRPINFLGDISYSLYLLHLLILGSFSSYIFQNLLHSWNFKIAFIFTFIFSAIFLFGLSFLFYKFVDRKSVTLSKKIFKSTQQSEQAVAG